MEEAKDTRPDAEWFNKVRAVFERNEGVENYLDVYYVPELRIYGGNGGEAQRIADRFTSGLHKFVQGWEASEEEIGQPRFVRRYVDVLKPFAALMLKELCANSGKGDRPGWLKMTPTDALLEIFYHVGKLQKALKDHDNAGIVEHSADVANLCLMMTDICGLLDVPGGRPNSAWPTVAELMRPVDAPVIHANVSPVWLDTLDMFTERLRKAGWRDSADAQHEGVKEMFDEAWAMRPALKPVDQLLVDGIIKPYGANMVEVMSSLKPGQSLVVTPHDAATGKGYSMKVIDEDMIK